MQKNNEFIELVEQTARSINMLSADDLTDVKQLKKDLSQIIKIIEAENLDGSASASNIKSKAVEAMAIVETVLTGDIDGDAEIAKVSKIICDIQEIVENGDSDQVDSSDTNDEDANTNANEDTTQASQTDVYIPEDDIPLVLEFFNPMPD